MKFLRIPKDVLSFLFCIALITACSTSSSGPKAGLPVSRSVILGQTRTSASAQKSSLNEAAIRQKMNRFQAVLARGTPLSSKDWKIHDELLNAYIQLKNKNLTANHVTIPAHSQLKLNFPSFCLNSNRASPADSERYDWRKADPKILYYREVLEFSAIHPKEASQSDVQTLLWNLQNETYWENYPDSLKSILQQIDPNASSKLP